MRHFVHCSGAGGGVREATYEYLGGCGNGIEDTKECLGGKPTYSIGFQIYIGGKLGIFNCC